MAQKGVMTKIGWGALAAALCLTLTQPAQARDRVVPPASVTADHQRDWSRGHQMEADGAVRLTRAERDLAEARQRIERGESRSTTAQTRLENARTQYRDLVGGIDMNANSSAALRHSRSMKTAAERWADAEGHLDDGRDLLGDGRARLARAERDQADAQQRIDRGRTMQAQAERASTLGLADAR